MYIHCPTLTNATMENPVPLGPSREIVRELKEIESIVRLMPKTLGWLTYTDLGNAHIMRFLGKLKAQPYKISVKDNVIFFNKEVK